LGFQFAPDGKLWTARDNNGQVVLDEWLFGPGDDAAGAYILSPTFGQTTATADFLGFQFVTTPDPGTAVPEPATWALLIAGFGLAGGSLRRTRSLA
ncbi:MAG: PEPxxWA-CTERM sorting domain-containing protein, partial [Pseudomonadota bacterium]